MSEKKEPIKVSLKVAIGLIVVLLILTAIMSMYFLNKSNKKEQPIANQLVKNEVVEENKKDVEEKVDLNIALLKENNIKENMIYSPLSIKYALSMLSEGAANKTKEQIDNLLPEKELTKYENKENILSLANSVFIKDTYKDKVKEEYINALKNKYDAEFRFDDFTNANNMNDWIEEKTFGILTDIIPDDVVKEPNAKMFLINALAIDMEWEHTFDCADTFGQDFNKIDGTKLKAAMMHKKTASENVKYIANDELTAVSMNLGVYEEEEENILEFVAIMPKEIELEKYIKEFTTEKYEEIIDELTPASDAKDGISLAIPRFDYDHQIPLVENLQKLGMQDAFNQVMADFSKMADTQLYVNDAIHKADIEFNEEGTKAAAVTVLMMFESMAIMEETKPVSVVFDNPFLYFIRDIKTGEVWFVGTVYEPVAWEDVANDYR